MEYRVVFLALCTLFLFIDVEAALKEGDCEVCIKMVNEFKKSLEDEKIEADDKVQARIREICSKKKNKENRFCYYIGGTDIAATGILSEVSKRLVNHLPSEKICEKLKKTDSQICELKYDKPRDWKNINLKKMKVKELKKILSEWDENCNGCLEKQDFIDRIEELKPLYVIEPKQEL